MPEKPEPLSALAGPLYLFALVLAVSPVLEVAVAAWPVQPGNLGWRFGTAGLLVGATNLPILGVLIAGSVALHLGRRRVLRALAVLISVAAVSFVVVLAAFLLDGTQLRASVLAEARPAFDRAMGKAIVHQLLVIAVLGSLGVRGLRISKRKESSGAKLVEIPLD